MCAGSAWLASIAVRSRPNTVQHRFAGGSGLGAPRLAAIYDMSVVDRRGGRWYVKDIRGSCGSPMTPMRPRKRTDAHGREG